jgi:hypothetical protein
LQFAFSPFGLAVQRLRSLLSQVADMIFQVFVSLPLLAQTDRRQKRVPFKRVRQKLMLVGVAT